MKTKITTRYRLGRKMSDGTWHEGEVYRRKGAMLRDLAMMSKDWSYVKVQLVEFTLMDWRDGQWEVPDLLLVARVENGSIMQLDAYSEDWSHYQLSEETLVRARALVFRILARPTLWQRFVSCFQ